MLSRLGYDLVAADDLSAEGFGSLRWVLWNPDEDWSVLAGSGVFWARLGWIGSVRARRGNAADGSTGGFGSLCCSLWRVDVAWRGTMGRQRPGRQRSGLAGFGKDCRRQYGGSALPTVLLGTGLVRSAEVRSGEIWRGEARLGEVT